MGSKVLADTKIDVKIKLAALWASVMFLYIYADFFTLFVPGRIDKLNSGHSGVGDTTPVKILIFAVLMTIPSLMVFLSVALNASVNRIVNIAVGGFYTLVIMLVVATSFDEWRLFYTYMGIVEILVTSAVVFYALKWPRHGETVEELAK